jgi:hypothetical protein
MGNFFFFPVWTGSQGGVSIKNLHRFDMFDGFPEMMALCVSADQLRGAAG